MKKIWKLLIGNMKDAIYRSLKKIRGTSREPQGLGVIMNDEQYNKLHQHLTTIADETSRREKKVEDNLTELKKIEYVKTYTALVRDITMAVTALNGVEGSEEAREKLLKTLTDSPNILKELHAEKNINQVSEVQIQIESTPEVVHKEIEKEG